MIVLDTHVWLWWAASTGDLSSRARGAVEQADELGVCAISCWEVAMLVVKERLRLDRDSLTFLRQALALPRVRLLALTPEAAVAAARLGNDALPGDPADCMIAATALENRVAVVTKDARLRRFRELQTIW